MKELDINEAGMRDDAKRYRWLCDGNGYFMEEEGLCGHGPDKSEADRRIDEEMRQEDKEMRQEEALTGDLNANERRLLLYCETCAVDYDGRMDDRHLNGADLVILEGWNEYGFIKSGRVAPEHVSSALRDWRARWCCLSEEAWKEAHRQRRLQAKQAWESRRWITTAEKRVNG